MKIETLFDGLTRTGPGDSASLRWAVDLAGAPGKAALPEARVRACGHGVPGAKWRDGAARAALCKLQKPRLDDLMALLRVEIELWRAHGDKDRHRSVMAGPA